MKTRTVTVHEGERLGPVDESFDWKGHARGMSEKHAAECWDRLLKLARWWALPEVARSERAFEATSDGGWPRVGWGRVLDVGMYDGWPYWRAVPSVLVAGTLGAEWHCFTSITEIREMSP